MCSDPMNDLMFIDLFIKDQFDVQKVRFKIDNVCCNAWQSIFSQRVLVTYGLHVNDCLMVFELIPT